MEVLSRKSVLAIAAVTDIALHANLLPAPSAVIATRQRLPLRRIEPLLRALVEAGILSASTGPQGGYKMSREPRLVTLGEIVRASLAAEGPARRAAPSSPLVCNIIEPAVRDIGGLLLKSLDMISVEDVCGIARHSDAAALTTH